MKIEITQLVWVFMAALWLLGFWYTGDVNFMSCVLICVATSHILFFINKGDK